MSLQKLTMTTITAFCSSGTGKTTLLTHLTYYCASQGIETVLIELDNRNSLRTCCGLPESDFSTSNIFNSDFAGDYQFSPLWQKSLKGKALVCQAQRENLLATEQFLNTQPLGILRLKQVLQKYPLSQPLILLDSPGQEGVMSSSAILASDYVILSIEPTPKAMSDAIRFVEILLNYEEQYGIEVPHILGIVIGLYNQDVSMARSIIEQLPEIAEKIDTQIFAPIRYSTEFLNSYDAGVPLNIYRPGHEGVKDFYIDGNLFKSMSNKRLRGLNREHLEKLPAIASYIVDLVKKENGF